VPGPDARRPSVEVSPIEVKICGVTRREDAGQAASAGADYIGAILSPGYSRSIEPEIAATFLEGGGATATLVAVFVDLAVPKAARAARTAGAGVIQLHGDERPDHLRALRAEGPWRLWKAVRVRRPAEVLAAAERWVGIADGLLLDGFREGSGGGQGARFPWKALEVVRHQVPVELKLVVAGGLTPENVDKAVSRLAPDVVDVSSGVERLLGVKDPDRVRAFIQRARAAAELLPRPADARIAEAG
jgi:phosphoribosylanthranilate isomerase